MSLGVERCEAWGTVTGLMTDLLRGVKEREGPKKMSIFLFWVDVSHPWEEERGWVGKESVNEKVSLESWT